MRICATCAVGAVIGLLAAGLIGYGLLIYGPDLPEGVFG